MAISLTPRCSTRSRPTGTAYGRSASDHGRDASALKLGINRITILEDGGLEAAAERLGEMREIGFDHAIANLHPGAANPEELLQEFAATHLAGLQAD